MAAPVQAEGDYDLIETFDSDPDHVRGRFPDSSPGPSSSPPPVNPNPMFRPSNPLFNPTPTTGGFNPTPNYYNPHPSGFPEPSPPPTDSTGDGGYFLLIVLGIICIILGITCRYYFYKMLFDAARNNNRSSSTTVATTPLVRPATNANAESPSHYGGTVDRPQGAAPAPYAGQGAMNYNYQQQGPVTQPPFASAPPPPILPSAPPAPVEPEMKFVDDKYIANTFGGTKSCIQQTCVVCLDVEKSIVMEPCKHFCACYDCAKKLKECPLCREKITGFAQYIPGMG